MEKHILTLIDTTGIQEYIFGSNDLGQNIGASELVAQATRDWVFEALDEAHLRHNGQRRQTGRHTDWVIRDKRDCGCSLPAEVIYAGGGNAALIFLVPDDSRQFLKKLSFRALRDAPDLQLISTSTTFGKDDPQGVYRALSKLQQAANERRQPRPASLPLLGLGVTAACDFTARPVYSRQTQHGEEAFVSRGVHAKLAARESAENRLWHALRNAKLLSHNSRLIRDFDEFGQADESSYIALIHADGNRMGERFKAIGLDDHIGADGERKYICTDNDDYVRQVRAFSASIQTAAETALCATVDALLATCQHDSGFDCFGCDGAVKTLPGYLPFRPVVFGGDDVTFVADGRLGLALAAAYLQALLPQTAEEEMALKLADGQPLASRAGVAIVKNHYPFARAYQIAEALAKSAKSALGPNAVSALDWHISTSGAILELEAIRARDYTDANQASLLMRPVGVAGAPDGWRSWKGFRELIREFNNPDNPQHWCERRNKVKSLREALREGNAALKLFAENYGALPPVDGLDPARAQGLEGRRAYFDAVEALDWFVALD